MGWFTTRDDFYGGGNQYWVGIAEWGYDTDFTEESANFGYNCLLSTQLTPHAARFKFYRAAATTWSFFYDDDNNGTYCQVTSFAGVSFQQWMASSLTALKGGDDTDAYDHLNIMFHSLSPNDAGMTAWPGNTWWKDCIPYYGYHWVASNDWEIKVGSPCTP